MKHLLNLKIDTDTLDLHPDCAVHDPLTLSITFRNGSGMHTLLDPVIADMRRQAGVTIFIDGIKDEIVPDTSTIVSQSAPVEVIAETRHDIAASVETIPEKKSDHSYPIPYDICDYIALANSSATRFESIAALSEAYQSGENISVGAWIVPREWCSFTISGIPWRKLCTQLGSHFAIIQCIASYSDTSISITNRIQHVEPNQRLGIVGGEISMIAPSFLQNILLKIHSMYPTSVIHWD